MSLDIKICNTFNTQSNTEVDVGTSSIDPNPTIINPGGCTSKTLSSGSSTYIWAKKNDQVNCQVCFHVDTANTSGTGGSNFPVLGIKLTGSKWKLTNDGTNTSSQVDIGPDGQ